MPLIPDLKPPTHLIIQKVKKRGTPYFMQLHPHHGKSFKTAPKKT
jgi:hypothetical protein